MAVENSTVLIIVNNWGIEETELTRPLRDLKAAGAKVTLAATTLDPCETVQHDRYEGETLTPDARLSDVQAADYDLLVVPGGTCNVDRIRVNEDAITLAQEFAHEGKPIAAICHGAWLLVNAGLVAGKTAAPCRYIAADIENAGGHYVDEQLHVDDANGFKLITSRKPDDLDYFGRNQGCAEVTESPQADSVTETTAPWQQAGRRRRQYPDRGCHAVWR